MIRFIHTNEHNVQRYYIGVILCSILKFFLDELISRQNR